jgi:hypothetical protein
MLNSRQSGAEGQPAFLSQRSSSYANAIDMDPVIEEETSFKVRLDPVIEEEIIIMVRYDSVIEEETSSIQGEIGPFDRGGDQSQSETGPVIEEETSLQLRYDPVSEEETTFKVR